MTKINIMKTLDILLTEQPYITLGIQCWIWVLYHLDFIYFFSIITEIYPVFCKGVLHMWSLGFNILYLQLKQCQFGGLGKKHFVSPCRSAHIIGLAHWSDIWQLLKSHLKQYEICTFSNIENALHTCNGISLSGARTFADWRGHVLFDWCWAQWRYCTPSPWSALMYDPTWFLLFLFVW